MTPRRSSNMEKVYGNQVHYQNQKGGSSEGPQTLTTTLSATQVQERLPTTIQTSSKGGAMIFLSPSILQM